MGREIRMVPPNWEHPLGDDGDYLPMTNRTYAQATTEWHEGVEQWKRGEHWLQVNNAKVRTEYPNYKDFWGDPPSPDDPYFRPEYDEEPTCLGFAHFKPRRRVNLSVRGTGQPGLSIYPVLRRTVKNPPTPATSGGAPERWHPRKLATAWRTRPRCDGSWAVVPESSEPPG